MNETGELPHASIDSSVAGVEGRIRSAPWVGNGSTRNRQRIQVAEHEDASRARAETCANPAPLLRGHHYY